MSVDQGFQLVDLRKAQKPTKIYRDKLFAGEYKTVIVFKLDRLSRSLTDGLTVISDWLSSGVRLVSTSQQFDFSGAIGKMLSAVLLSVAEMENGSPRGHISFPLLRFDGLQFLLLGFVVNHPVCH